MRGISASVKTIIVALLLLLAPAFAATPPAGADTTTTLPEPTGDISLYAPDLGDSTITVKDDDTLTVFTKIVPVPPAGWGGYAYCIGIAPYQTCIPSDMNVTWYFDYKPNAGDSSSGGADAKMIVIPSLGTDTWESSTWDAAAGKFTAGALPAASESPDGITWSLRLGDLGIPRPAAVRMWAISTYNSYNGLGQLLNYSDTTTPGTFSVAAGPVVGTMSRSCRGFAKKINRLERRMRSARRHGRSSAYRALKRTRSRYLRKMKRKCSTASTRQVSAVAPKGCHVVTKPQLVQDGTGIYAPWVVREQAVVECS